ERATAGDEVVRTRLEEALEKLEEAHVNTIHGFCAELLRERPVEARVDPLFAVLTEPQSARLYDRAFSAWLQETLAQPGDGVRRLSRQIRLEQSFGHRDLEGWEARLVDLLRDRGFSRTRKGSGHKYGNGVARIDVLTARDQLFADLQQFKRNADADLAAALQQ